LGDALLREAARGAIAAKQQLESKRIQQLE
jgi:hypothetical protein